MDLSVIIPVYNGEAFLPDAIGSVVAQTRRPAELLVGDDGSTDRSAEVAELFAGVGTGSPGRLHPTNIRVLRLPHRGVCATRNELFAEAKGRWVFNLDADNKLEPDFLEKICAFIEEKEAADPKFAFAYPDRLTFGDYVQMRVGEEFGLEKFKRGNIADMNCAVRADVVRKFGFDPEFESGSWEDYDLFLTIARAGYTGAAFHGPPLHYRVHTKSRTARSDRCALMRRLVAKHRGFWTEEEEARVLALYSGEAVARFRMFELLWARRYGALAAFAAKCLFTRPRVFFSRDGIPKLLGIGGGGGGNRQTGFSKQKNT